MREKLQTLPVAVLKEMAKKQGIKGATALRKAELIEALCNAAEENIGHETAVPENSQPTRTSYQNRGQNGRPAAARRNNNAQGEQQSYQNRQNQNGEQTYQNRQNQNGEQTYQNRQNQNGEQTYQNRQNQNGEQTYQNRQAQNGEQPYQNRQNQNNEQPAYQNNRDEIAEKSQEEMDSGVPASGILEVMPDGFGFIRCENFLPGENDVYVSPTQIRRFNLKTGDIINGNRRVKTSNEKFAALLYIKNVNGYPVSALERRPNFEDLTPIFPNSRLHMETQGKSSTAMRVLDLLAPIGKGQRGMIVSPPKAGKTTLLKQVAQAVTNNHPDMHMIILLIDERPEEVTDIKESVVGNNVEVIYSTFDELPERHKRVSEMVIERAKRLVEHGRDVIILLDSITRLARAYNLVVPPSGRTLSGGLDPAALHMPKRFFGAARNMREGGSLTILATALVDTGSRMDDVIYEEFKGTGNMELVLDRKLSEKRIFPAIDILKSGTRRDDLLLSRDEAEAVDIVRKATNSLKPEDSVERILDLFAQTRTNREFVEVAKKRRMF
ncbi:MAG: transcription termination factor Rho [Clostridiaceae bacterium]|nr:transcription termination factor Rho [Clostridiaceae bacterium]